MNITTLEQAGRHLMEVGAVDFNTMTVDGKQLLEVCGFSTSNAKARLDEQVTRHDFEINKDFTISIEREGNIKRNVYHFTMNAANHILLAAMTEKGKAARQQAIDLREAVDNIPVELAERMMREVAESLTRMGGEQIAKLAHSYDAKIQERNDLIIKKSEPVSLTKILGNSHKVVQAANLWLEGLDIKLSGSRMESARAGRSRTMGANWGHRSATFRSSGFLTLSVFCRQ